MTNHIFGFILILIINSVASWRTLDDIDDTTPTTLNDVWKWEDFKNTDDVDQQDDELFPEKLQPLANQHWSWQNSIDSNANKDSSNRIPSRLESHRKKKQYWNDNDYSTSNSYNNNNNNKKGIPRISTELYKAILGESKSFQEVVYSILNPARLLEEYYRIFSDQQFQNTVKQGDLNEAKISIEKKLCELGLMKCIQNHDYDSDNDNRDLYDYSKPFTFENNKPKREAKKYSQTRQSGSSRPAINNYGNYGSNDVGGLGSIGGLNLGSLPQTFASLTQKNIAPTFGFSFGLPIPAGAYPFNAIGGGLPPVNPYFGSLSPNGVKLGLVNVNPLVSVQYTKDEYGDKIVKPLVHLHITPNENILNQLGGFLKAKKQEALHNFHHHYHEHEYPALPYPSPLQPPQHQYQPHSLPLPQLLPTQSLPSPLVPSTPIHYDHNIHQTPYFQHQYQHQYHQNQQHQHHHYYDDFNSKFISSSGNDATTVIPNYQYGLLYPYGSKDGGGSDVIKTHISDVAPTYFTGIGDESLTGSTTGVDTTYHTINTSGYQTGYPTGYEDYYGITSKSQKLNNIKSESTNNKLRFPEGRTVSSSSGSSSGSTNGDSSKKPDDKKFSNYQGNDNKRIRLSRIRRK